MIRSIKKGPFVAYQLLQKIKEMNLRKYKQTIKTWSRASTILPGMVGNTVSVYNGRQHIPVFISSQIVGHKLGEFVPTRVFRAHKTPGKKPVK